MFSGLSTIDRIAVIGATDRDGSIGQALMENLLSFDGEVVPVNPNRESVMGMPCYASMDDLPSSWSIDMIVVAIPAPSVVDVVRTAGKTGISTVVIISAGFSETGEQGRQREQELHTVAEQYGLTLVGPNCAGVISTPRGLNATFLEKAPPEGSISLMSQSGAFISAVLGWANQHGIGFKDVVSLGNATVFDESDLLEAWGEDSETEVIMAYLEDIDDGQRFIETTRNVTSHTPVVVIKSGRTDAGAAAAASHTGALAGTEQVYQAGFHQAGVLSARTLQDAFDIGRVLTGQPLLKRDEIAVITNGGGPGVLTADAVSESRLNLSAFGEPERSSLADLLPDEADVTNPLDIIGDADIDRFRRTLDVVLNDDTVGGVILICVPTALLEFETLAETVGGLHERHEKPVVACLMGGEAADQATRTLESYGIPNYFDPARAVTSLQALSTYRDIRDRTADTPTSFDVNLGQARAMLEQARARDVDYLGLEAMALLDAYGIPTPTGKIVNDPTDATEVAADIGGPVVMKIVSPDILHKSDVGGVEIGVPVEAVEPTFRTLCERVARHDADTTLLGIRVEELVAPPSATETIVGVTRDPSFGHVVMFGLGGIYVQIFDDTAFRVAPVSEQEARTMITELRTAPILTGARGKPSADIDAVADTIQRISQLLTEFPAITELDINPLIVSADGVCAVDFRLTVNRSEISGTGM